MPHLPASSVSRNQTLHCMLHSWLGRALRVRNGHGQRITGRAASTGMSGALNAKQGKHRKAAQAHQGEVHSCPMVGFVEVQGITSASDITNSAGPPCARTSVSAKLC